MERHIDVVLEFLKCISDSTEDKVPFTEIKNKVFRNSEKFKNLLDKEKEKIFKFYLRILSSKNFIDYLSSSDESESYVQMHWEGYDLLDSLMYRKNSNDKD